MKNTNKGFTLIEVLMALFIFSIVCASTAPAFINHSKMNSESEVKTISINLAEKILNNLRKEDVTQFPSSGSKTTNYNVSNKNLNAVIVYCQKSQYCSKASRHLIINIFYHNKLSYSVETVYTQLQ